ncbi:hypothetical protein H0H81_002524, partial [Sphagnurus paluster]
MPQFIGQWFPRNNDPNVCELYCASILMLLKPWESLPDLLTGFNSFDAGFKVYYSHAKTREKNIVENIQYYYDSLDNAVAHTEAQSDEGGPVVVTELEDNLRQCFPEIDTAFLSEPTEEDFEAARQSAVNPREQHFGEQVLHSARQAGMFKETTETDVVWQNLPGKATFEDVEIYRMWEKRLKAVTRTVTHNELTEGKPIDGRQNKHGMAENQVEGVFAVGVDNLEARINQQRLSILNADQRRAYDIIERQLLAEL